MTADDHSFGPRDIEPPDKARKNGKLPHLPDRDASFSVLRQWVSNAIGLPPTVRVETVTRFGRDDEDSLSLSLSNDVVIRCNRQKRLHSPGPFSAFFASESDGLCRPQYLSRAEVADVFTALCALGTAEEKETELEILQERIDMYLTECQAVYGSMAPKDRFDTITRLKARPTYDPKSIRDKPVVVMDVAAKKRYIRALEFASYLRVIHGQTVNESILPGRMQEAGCARHAYQAWNEGRTKKVALVFFELASESE